MDLQSIYGWFEPNSLSGLATFLVIGGWLAASSSTAADTPALPPGYKPVPFTLPPGVKQEMPSRDGAQPPDRPPSSPFPAQLGPGGIDYEYSNDAARLFILEAREFDPQFCADPEKRDRDKAAHFYERAIDAQPGSPINAVIANRIAQLYAHFADREKGVLPRYEEAIKWWKRCLEMSDRSQFLWAQAQMGLACSAITQRNPESALVILDEILTIEPAETKPDRWKTGPAAEAVAKEYGRPLIDPPLQDQSQLQKRLVGLTAKARELRSSTERLIAHRQDLIRSHPDGANPESTTWWAARKILLGLNVALAVILISVVIYRHMSKPGHLNSG